MLWRRHACIAHGGISESIKVEAFAGKVVCVGIEPFWSLDYEDSIARWSHCGSEDWQEPSLAGSFQVAGSARGSRDDTDEADYVLVAEPAEIEISESDDFAHTHHAMVVTPQGQLLKGACSFPATPVGWWRHSG